MLMHVFNIYTSKQLNLRIAFDISYLKTRTMMEGASENEENGVHEAVVICKVKQMKPRV